MPNHCDNKLTITGGRRAVVAFLDKAFPERVAQVHEDFGAFDGITAAVLDEKCLLVRLHPLPEELEETTCNFGDNLTEALEALVKKYGAHDWYSWRIKNWGTKWGCYSHYDVHMDDVRSPRLRFSTAWSPPSNGVCHISTMFPELRFKLQYWECGCGFCGMDLYQNGDIVDSTYNNQYRGRRGG